MSETRMRILQLLKMRAGMTVGQLTEALHISQMGVRQHLAILEAEGLVAHYQEKQGRGRPVHVYQLTDEANGLFPTTYANFAVGLMHEVAKFNGPGFINKVFRGRMKSQLETYQQRLEGKTLSERVKELARIRDEEGYMARFEEDGDDYVLIEHNCPIAVIAQEYPHVCEIETLLFRQSLGAKVVREEHLMRGSHRCCYRISKTKEK
ncbi:ArsR family transcriptional regulator [Candidatus Poribacteria bacterium]|nr:MAG: ArsR family transcriptional regulator [Candidatus Poribacteria bacterium]